ncbi:MAG: cytoplasmic protein [Clostridiales bacterium]|nr:cytoplasmic protein [Clostridiales bacterium]
MTLNNPTVFYAFQGEKMCFLHLLFNALDLHEKGFETKIVIEGKSTALVKSLIEERNPLFEKVWAAGLIDSVCKACANQMGVLTFFETETDLPINGDLIGHPPMAPYIAKGYQVITL